MKRFQRIVFAALSGMLAASFVMLPLAASVNTDAGTAPVLIAGALPSTNPTGDPNKPDSKPDSKPDTSGNKREAGPSGGSKPEPGGKATADNSDPGKKKA